MILYTFMSSAFLVVLAYGALTPGMLKKPWILLIMGFVVSAFGIMVKSLPVTLKMTPAFKDSVFMDIAASVADPTLIGLAGGLIGSAFILKIQILYEKEKESHAKRVLLIEDAKNHLHMHEEEISNDSSLTPDQKEFRENYIKELRREIFMDEHELKLDSKKLDAKD